MGQACLKCNNGYTSYSELLGSCQGVIGVDSELVIDELLHENEAGGTGGDVRVRTGMERQEVHLLSSQVLHL